MSSLTQRLTGALESRVWLVLLIGALISVVTLVLGEIAAEDTRQRVRAAQLSAQGQAATRAAQRTSDLFAEVGEVLVAYTSPNGSFVQAVASGNPTVIDGALRDIAGTVALRNAVSVYVVDTSGMITYGYETGVVVSDRVQVVGLRGDVLKWIDSPTNRLGARFMNQEEFTRTFAGPDIYLSPMYVATDRQGELMTRDTWVSNKPGEIRFGHRFAIGRRIASIDGRPLGALVADIFGGPFVDSVFHLKGISTDCYLIDRNGLLVRRLRFLDPDREMGTDLSSTSAVKSLLAGRTLQGEGEDPFVGGAALLSSAPTPDLSGIRGRELMPRLTIVASTPLTVVYAEVDAGLALLRVTRIALAAVLVVFATLLTVTLRRNVKQRAALEIAGRQIAAATRHKSEFLANMSHELRTPLNAIIGFADVLGQSLFGELNPKQAEYVGDISGSGRHLLALVNEILDLSKVEAGRMELERTDFSAAEMIRSTVTFVRERAASHAIRLSVEVADDLGSANGDERKIRQVVLNLLSNAVKFTPAGGTIQLTARRENGELVIAVSDTGIGIAPEDQAKVFEEFRQVGRPSDRSREGTGLGLTLAKKFVELHGGRIWLESALGKGTTFTFALPVGHTARVPLTA